MNSGKMAAFLPMRPCQCSLQAMSLQRWLQRRGGARDGVQGPW